MLSVGHVLYSMQYKSGVEHERGRDADDAVGLLAEEVVPALPLQPAPLATLVVDLAPADGRGVLQILVLQQPLEVHLNALAHPLSSQLPLHFILLLLLRVPSLLLHLSQLPHHFLPSILTARQLLCLLLRLVLDGLIIEGLVAAGLVAGGLMVLDGVVPLGGEFEPMHPTLGQLAAQHALLPRPPVIYQHHRGGDQPGESLPATHT